MTPLISRARVRAIAALLLLSTLALSPAALADPQTTEAQTCTTLQGLQWLLGDWQTVPAAGQTSGIFESWSEVSSSTFEGIGETRDAANGELKSREELRLVQMGGEIFYIAKVGHNALPVAFRLTECSETSAVFENPEHDSPKKLEYRLGDGSLGDGLLSDGLLSDGQPTGGSQLTVTVSDGAEKGFRLHFQRRD